MKLISTLALGLYYGGNLCIAQNSESDWFPGDETVIQKAVRGKSISFKKAPLHQKCLSKKCNIDYKKFARLAFKSGFQKKVFIKCNQKRKSCSALKSTEAAFENYKKCLGVTAAMKQTKKFKKLNQKKQKKTEGESREKCNKALIKFLKCKNKNPKDGCSKQKGLFDSVFSDYCGELDEYWDGDDFDWGEFKSYGYNDTYGYDYGEVCEFDSDCEFGSGCGSDEKEETGWIPPPTDVSKEIKCGVRAEKGDSNLYDPNDPGRWSDIESRVLGGESADDGEFPWQISLKYERDGKLIHFCGGSIIDRFTILTAAHCLNQFDSSDSFYVLGGLLKNYEKSVKDMEKIYKSDIENFGTFIQKISPSEGQGNWIIHPDYKGDKDDIALIKLSEELKYPRFADAEKEDVSKKNPVGSLIRPICLPDSDDLIEPIPGGAETVFSKKTMKLRKKKKLTEKTIFWENKQQKKSIMKSLKKQNKKNKNKAIKRAKKNGMNGKKQLKVLGSIRSANDDEFCDLENHLKKNPYWISGWGNFDVKETLAKIIAQPITMQKAAIIPVSNRYCAEAGAHAIHESQVCADNLPGCAQIDVCAGDSGGPISWKVDRAVAFMQEGKKIKEDRYKIVGLVSYGQSCSKWDNGNMVAVDDVDRTPGVYTRISSYIDWIKKYASNTQTIYTGNEK